MSDDTSEGIIRNLSIQSNTDFNLPAYPADTQGYVIFPEVYDSATSFSLNNEFVQFDTFFGNHYVDTSLISPFGRYNLFEQNEKPLDSFYLPKRLVVSVNHDFEISQGDTFTWIPEAKNKFLLFYTLEGDQTHKLYLIKDDGQFIVPKSPIQGMKEEDYVRFSFSRSYENILVAPDGILVRLSSYTGSSGHFRIKKATP